MARIRTIKPEFPQSESMGRVSRDARLLFIQLWTLVDDGGRARGNSRILASLLYPYDEDAIDLIDGWLAELEREGCVARYTHGKGTYIQVLNWLDHQKIDKPSKSKLPEFDNSSRTFASPREESRECREASSGDLDLDQDLEGKGREGSERKRARDGKALEVVSPSEPAAPTRAAAACVAMRAEGLMTANPSHPVLLELLAEGAEVGEFAQAAKEAAGAQKGFAYALAIVRGRRQDAARMAANASTPSPQPIRTWEPPDDEPETTRAQA